MPPRRILYINHVSRVSGAERSLLDLLHHLDRSRFEPLVALPPGGELTDLLRQTGVSCHAVPLRRLHKTVNPIRLAADLLNAIRIVWQLTRLIRRERITLVHANSTTAQVYAGIAARLGGIPCVWHVRDLVNLGPLGFWLARFSSLTIAISDSVRRHVEPYLRNSARLRTLPNGIDLEEFRPHDRRAEVRRSLGIAPGAPVFGMVGQFVPWKGHGAFIEAAARLAAALPAARFVVAGDDLFREHSGYREELEARATELGLKHSLLFTGYRPDMANLIEAFDVLIHPAAREPLGRVILEAMAMGKPVVAVNAEGPAEIVRHGLDGLLSPTNRPEELAEAALRLITDPSLAERLGAAARLRVEQSFDIRQKVREIEALYDELPAGGGSSCA
jgi:glycosyltransferase involved in cell wall biosynthesis